MKEIKRKREEEDVVSEEVVKRGKKRDRNERWRKLNELRYNI